jgi:hypothetical protein
MASYVGIRKTDHNSMCKRIANFPQCVNGLLLALSD